MKNVPEIRFKGFTDAWAQRKLSSLVDFSNGINAPREQYGKGRKMISVMDILANGRIKYSTIKNSVEVDKKTEYNYKVECGDLIFVRSSEVVSEVGWVKAYTDDEYALFSGFSIRGKKKNDFDNFFIELSLNSKNRTQIESKAGGSTRFNVNQSILSDVVISQPSLSEQAAIGSFFRTLDDLITGHKRKLDGLRELKRAYLQQMFPQTGKRVPKVRFVGFFGNWERQEFRIIIKRISKTNNDNILPRVEFEDIISGSGQLNKNILEKASYKIGIEFDEGDILFGKLRPYLKNWLLADFKGVAVGDFWVLRPNENDKYYVYHLIQSASFQEVANLSTGTKMPRSDWDVVSEAEFGVPALPEQAALGNFLRILDSHIVKLQSKIDKLIKLKSAYLQKMLV